MGPVVFLSAPHTASSRSAFINVYYSAAENSPEQNHYFLLLEEHLLKATVPSCQTKLFSIFTTCNNVFMTRFLKIHVFGRKERAAI